MFLTKIVLACFAVIFLVWGVQLLRGRWVASLARGGETDRSEQNLRSLAGQARCIGGAMVTAALTCICMIFAFRGNRHIDPLWLGFTLATLVPMVYLLVKAMAGGALDSK